MKDIGRMQWSKTGVTVYEPSGGMMFKLEHPEEIRLLNVAISIAFEKIRDARKIQKEESIDTCHN